MGGNQSERHMTAQNSWNIFSLNIQTDERETPANSTRETFLFNSTQKSINFDTYYRETRKRMKKVNFYS